MTDQEKLKRNDTKIKIKLVCAELLPLAIFVSIIIFYHIFGYRPYGDDMVVRELLKPTLMEELTSLQRSYEGWSSRFLINPIIWILLHLDIRIWGVINVLLFAVGMQCLVQFVVHDNKNIAGKWIVMAMVLIFPFEISIEVGWIVTSVTYIWPLIAGLFSCLTIKHFFNHEKNKWKLTILVLFTTVFAANKEEMSVTLVILFLYTIVKMIMEKRFDLTLCLQFAVSVWSVFVHLFNKGNTIRYNSSAHNEDISILKKMCMGVEATLYNLFFDVDKNCFFLCVCFLLCVLTLTVIKKRWVRIVSIIPVTICSGLMISGLFITGTQGTMLIVSMIFEVIGIASALCCVYFIVNGGQWFVLIVVILISGFAGKITIGFSGAGFAPLTRTFAFFYCVLSGVMAYLILHCWSRESVQIKDRKIIKRILICMTVFSVVRCASALGIL